MTISNAGSGEMPDASFGGKPKVNIIRGKRDKFLSPTCNRILPPAFSKEANG